MDTPKLKSMKRSEKDRREGYGEAAPIEAIGPDYPYGLCMNLDQDELKKVGMSKLPKIGDEIMVYAKVKVTRVFQSASEGADDENSVSLQITDMAFGEG